MESQVTAALIAAVATIVAAAITTAGYLYVELRKRRSAETDQPADDDLRVEDDGLGPADARDGAAGGLDLRGRKRG